MIWHVLTGEYPPQPGGVSTYTRQVARGLAAAGDEVVVWAPGGAAAPSDPGVVVHPLPDRFGWRSLRVIAAGLDRTRAPHRLLVQYVPHAFGWRAANVPFCAWVASRRLDGVWVMFHEVAFPFDTDQPLSHNALAAVNRLMARLIARAAERVFVSIPGWRPSVDALVARETAVSWLPVPSGIDVAPDPIATAGLRDKYGDGHRIVGHFGTQGDGVRALLARAIPPLLRAADCRVLLIGPHGDAIRRAIETSDASLAARVHATGMLPEDAVSAHLAACDVMLQPYPDGLSTRRTSAMAALAHGLPLVTTSGWLTEPLWRESDAVRLVPVDAAPALAAEASRLLGSSASRLELGERGRALYEQRFALRHTIAVLRDPRLPSAARECA